MMLSRRAKYAGITLAVVALVTVSIGIGVVANAEPSNGAFVDAEGQADVLAARMNGAGIPIEKVTIETSPVEAYRVSVPAATWEEYITRTDDVMRETAMAKSEGLLDLDYVDLGVAAPEDPVKGTASRSAADSSFVIRINGIERGRWGAETARGTTEARHELERRLGEETAQFELKLVSLDVAVGRGAQVLMVTIACEGTPNVEKMTALREQLWGKIIPQFNAAGGDIGVGYMEFVDASGKQLSFEVSDAIIGWNQVHSDLAYPSHD
ncbi:MAG: hypothetical protein ACYCX3_07130 [Thermoleophilia bacterium]